METPTITKARTRASEENLESFARHACSTNPALRREYEQRSSLLRPGLGDLRYLVERLASGFAGRRSAGAQPSDLAPFARRLREARQCLGVIEQADARARGLSTEERRGEVEEAYAAFLAASRGLGMWLGPDPPTPLH